MSFIKQALEGEHLLAGIAAHDDSQPCFHGEQDVWNLPPSSECRVCDLRYINSSDEWELQWVGTMRHWSVEEHRWWDTAELRLGGWASSTALATLISPQRRSCTFLLCLYKNVLPNSFQETKAFCTSHCPAASLCFQVPIFREKCSWQILPFPYSDHFTEFKKNQKTNFEKFKLFSAACSVAAANRAGSWQQVRLGNVTHWWCILNVDPKRVAPAPGKLAAAPGVSKTRFQLYCLLQGAVISQKRLSDLCHDRPGLSCETLAAGWLHFTHFQD